jgi:D-lyxose ketol-isomerase
VTDFVGLRTLEAKSRFEKHGWVLPPNPRWDITDFGRGNHFVNPKIGRLPAVEEDEPALRKLISNR